MRIVGHGIDLVDVDKIAALLERHGDRFVQRCFTPEEAAYCRRSSKRVAEHFAARFAAKEAVLKALGTGRRHGIAWTDIDVVRLSTGEPTVSLGGVAGDIASGRGIVGWNLSLTHTNTVAAASAIALAD